jgi:hypothetical protein
VGHWWLTPIILAIWEAEIRKTVIRDQPRKIVHKTPSPKITTAKWTEGVAGVAELLL